tara:strand:+ start:175 stop:546 length:372 start_codon:yes stop_codon:yes gene_type:complete
MQIEKFITDSSKEYQTSERCSIIEIINSSGNENVSLAQARVAPGVITADHSLNETEEIYYILSGQGIAIVDAIHHNMTKGDAIIIPKGVHQSIENTGKEDLVFLCICTPRFQQENYINHENLE